MPTGARTSFHSRHAAWHALQPIHFDTSISLAIGVSWRIGAGTDEADRRMRSASPKSGATSEVPGLGNSNSNAIATSLRHRSGCDGFDVDEERLVFGRLNIGVTDKGRERIGAKA